MSESEQNDVAVRIFRGCDEEQFESYVQFFDSKGLILSQKSLCSPLSTSTDDYSEDRQLLDLDAFYFYEWDSLSRVECHSDIKEICLSAALRPKIGTIEFIDEKRKALISRGKYSFIDEDDDITEYDISRFFDMMKWRKPETGHRKQTYDLFDLKRFPVKIESHYREKSFEASVRFFDAVGNVMDLSEYITLEEYEDDELFEECSVINLAPFLKDCWDKVSAVEAKSDLTCIDRFKHVKGNIDYLIYCRSNNYKKLPEYLYKRIQTKKLDQFLADIKVGM
ncbi:MAG: hypothetical protein KC646_07925 [Candidatus Cloacimonetes bacterium]|nr:hypothetical protein [Candidatus Cloacimonadota bacterium]